MRYPVLFGSLFWLVFAAQSARSDDSSTDTRGPLSTAMYFGVLYKNFYPDILWEPEHLILGQDYLLAGSIDYRFYKWPNLPLQFEGEFDVTKHFGQAHEWEVVLAPFLRWTSFPWNKYLYTNVRFSALGPSYVAGHSAWELQNSGNNHGSNLLQYGSLELTFASSEHSSGEFFLKVHHRSGIYGLVNGVEGGSSYLTCGYRVFW